MMRQTEASVEGTMSERSKELVRALAEGELGYHQLPDELSQAERARIRRRALARWLGASGAGGEDLLRETGRYSLDAEEAGRRNCENFIGVARLPLREAGPVPVPGEGERDTVRVPLATHDYRLVERVGRGGGALAAASSFTVAVEDAGMTRAPVFRTSGYEETEEFLEWVAEHEEEIRRMAESTSRFITLREVRPFRFGTSVFLRFRFDTGDAMGMNMATIACDRVVEELIEPRAGVPCVALSGNYCVDKKPADVNFREGRGKKLFAEARLDAGTVEKELQTERDRLLEVQYRSNLLGSIAAGSLSFNADYAGVLSALFVATGQDPAHVVEASLGITCVEPADDGGVYASIYLPDVPLAAVGGGTELVTQREALARLGVEVNPEEPGRGVRRLGRITAAVLLGTELALLADRGEGRA